MSKATPSVDAAKPHGLIAKILHWGFIVVFVYALTKQLDEVDELEDLSLLHYEMAFAAVFLLLLITRFVIMHRLGRTALPSSTTKRTRVMAKAVHLGMYATLGLVAATGLCIGGLYWSGTKSGALMEIALLIHELAVNTSYFLILGHIAAALYHRYKGDGIWDAMVPLWREK